MFPVSCQGGLSENQGIKLQRRKEHYPFLTREKLKCLFQRKIVENNIYLLAHVRQVKIGQDEGL